MAVVGKGGRGMKRELKFRAWLPDGMIAWEQLKDKPMAMLEHATGYQFMQFTGLRDTNGEDVYEGDVLEATLLPEPNGRRVKGVVEFLQGQFDVVFGDLQRRHLRERQMLGHPGAICDFVIGNIYENPGLVAALQGTPSWP